MALPSRLTAVLCKPEGTPGTYEAMTADDGVFFAYVSPESYTEDITLIPRPSMGGGQHAQGHGMRLGQISLDFDIAGKGASGLPSWATRFLPMCGGSASSTTYSFGYSATPHSLAVPVNGMIRKLAGCVGTFTLTGQAGQKWMGNLTAVGKIVTDADQTFPAMTYENVRPPRWAGTANTLGSYALKCSRFSISLGAALKMLEDPSDATGAKFGCITDIVPSMTCDQEAELIATKDWYSLLTGETTGALSIVVGSSSNNTITIASSAVQVVGTPMGSRDGVAVRNLSMFPVWTGNSGTSPFTIALT